MEFQIETPITQTERDVLSGSSFQTVRFGGTTLEASLGHMANVSTGFAVGATLSYELGGDITTGGGSWTQRSIEVRARRWLNEDASLELSGGVLFREDHPTGATVDARVNVRDQVYLYLRWDGVSVPRDPPGGGYFDPGPQGFDPGGFQRALSIGAGLASKPGLIVGAIVSVLGVLAASGAD
jgi:hypothetical protein